MIAFYLNVEHGVWADNVSCFLFDQRDDLQLVPQLCGPPFGVELFIVGKLWASRRPCQAGKYEIMPCPQRISHRQLFSY